MPSPITVLLVVSAVAALAVVNSVWTWWRRRELLARIRGEWGAPRLKLRDMPAIASYHGALAGSSSIESLDQRT
ncbi:MAG TPA: hypothetical protein VFB99_21070, partial [Vicinamibacterales bacterium]|nr:hypothetical protein [Vicinamibacterales bacterium]